MRRHPSPVLQRIALPIAALIVAVAGGAGVAVLSSPASLSELGSGAAGGPSASRDGTAAAASPPAATPSPAATPTAPPNSVPAGQLGDSAQIVAASATRLLATGGSAAYTSDDGGRTWSALTLPPGSAGMAADSGTPQALVAGGALIQTSADGGATWRGVRVPPPAPGPYAPLTVSPFEPGVWFLTHGGKLLRTRDGGLSWKDLSDAGTLSDPAVMVPGGLARRFVIASGTRVLQLDDNGQTVGPRGTAPAPVVSLAPLAGDAVLAAVADGLAINTGTQWTRTGPAVSSGRVAAVPGKFSLAASTDTRLGGAAAVYWSADEGVVWKAATGLPSDQPVSAITVAPDGAAAFVYLHGGDLYTSTDGGRSWSQTSTFFRHP